MILNQFNNYIKYLIKLINHNNKLKFIILLLIIYKILKYIKNKNKKKLIYKNNKNILKPINTKLIKYKPDDINFLNIKELQVLQLICDTFFPGYHIYNKNKLNNFINDILKNDILNNNNNNNNIKTIPSYFRLSGSELGLHLLSAKVLEDSNQPLEKINELKLILSLLSSRWTCWLITKKIPFYKSFYDYTLNEREDILISWRDSNISKIRGLYQTLKKLICIQALSTTYELKDDLNAIHPTWKALEYERRTPEIVMNQLPEKQIIREKTLLSNILNITDDNTILEFDFIIIGSGAGGGVAAYELTRIGFKVLLIEKGKYYTEEDFIQWSEKDALNNFFECNGLQTSDDGNIAILSGTCIGGGTTVNWNASFETPSYVKNEWVNNFGLDAYSDNNGEYNELQNIVHKHVNVNILSSHRNNEIDGYKYFITNDNNQILYESAKNTNSTCLPIPRNVKNCIDCGSCAHGCPFSSKLGTMLTYIEEANNTGNLKILTETEAKKIIIKNKKAIGIECIVNNKYNIRINAKKSIISSCGAINTPALLLKSGLKNPLIGKYLALHPVIGTMGINLKKKLNHGKGVGMALYINDIMNINNSNHGLIIETPPIHPSIVGLLVPWHNPLHFRTSSLLWKNMGIAIGISRDYSQKSNHIKIDKNGDTRIYYNLTKKDREILNIGQEFMLNLAANNDNDIITMVNEGMEWNNNVNDKEYTKNYIKKTTKSGICDNYTGLFSAHQMSSCRMSIHDHGEYAGCVDENGKFKGIDNLYIADGSILPTALGVNPMITILSTSMLVIRRMIRNLGYEPGELEPRILGIDNENNKEW